MCACAKAGAENTRATRTVAAIGTQSTRDISIWFHSPLAPGGQGMPVLTVGIPAVVTTHSSHFEDTAARWKGAWSPVFEKGKAVRVVKRSIAAQASKPAFAL